MNIIQKIKNWYSGYVDIDDQMPESFTMTIHPQSRLRYFVCFLAAFWRRESKWIIGTILTITGLIIAASKL